MNSRSALLAYTLPFGLFLAFIALQQILKSTGSEAFWLREPQYWIFPLQTLLCAICLAIFWRHYDFRPLSRWPWGVLIGVVVLAVWISPQCALGQPLRTHGFNPDDVAPEWYGFTVAARFLRLVIVVPLVEEIFWRGFLLRYLVREDFSSVAFGTYRPIAFFGVALLFMLEHSTPDWPAAVVAGLLYNLVAVWTRSLFACVVAHAVTNGLLGLYIMQTRQWGFW